ncbi:NADH-ubiquinone oxidoreductase chain N [invertebrate metagenome]|uniref:NADH-ubiquinone oxidoreductase chain N n=1 Tax=invertebrate metagenome TaxID=1711999 RepID=A0A484H8U4_9ZZZZ
MMTELPDFLPAFPELFLICAALGLLMVGVFRQEGKKSTTDVVGLWAVLALIVTGFLVLVGENAYIKTFSGMFIIDRFSVFMKILVLIATTLTLVMSLTWLRREQLSRFEFPVLILFSTVGMFMMVSANDLMAMYLGLELQSLSLYVIATYHRDSSRSTEAGMKYFILGALASGFLLFGASFVYGFTGQTGFDDLARSLAGVEKTSLGAIIGVAFILFGLAFKVSAVPFHMWTPDVYEGAPTPATAFFALAPKMAAMALLVRVMTGPFMAMIEQWQQLVIVLAVASMILGAFAAINQTNIKRLMAYSSIGHIGYALIGLAVGNMIGVLGIVIYLAIYLVMNLGVFAMILSMRQKGRLVEGIDDLAGLAKTQPVVAAALAALMFSMAGIPPLAGFFGKLYVFIAAIEAQMYTLAVIGVLTSVVSAFYYLRIIKIMYFDEPVEMFDKPLSRSVILTLAASSVVVLFFFLYPPLLLIQAEAATASLFPG